MLESKIRMIPPLNHYVDKSVYRDVDENNSLINNFIDDLNNDENTTYNECCDSYGEKFNIEVDDDTIKIMTNNSTTILTIESKNQLIKAMNKYYDILNKYPRDISNVDSSEQF